ncbi:MAG: DUF1127 domain-containing protein [Limnobacter sp.]|nr:DUF1127 domain-containing protein [Limnobacter sp.]
MSSLSERLTNSYLSGRIDFFSLVRVPRLLAHWKRNFRTRQQLAELEDHLLLDIGVTRAEALREASKAFYE